MGSVHRNDVIILKSIPYAQDISSSSGLITVMVKELQRLCPHPGSYWGLTCNWTAQDIQHTHSNVITPSKHTWLMMKIIQQTESFKTAKSESKLPQPPNRLAGWKKNTTSVQSCSIALFIFISFSFYLLFLHRETYSLPVLYSWAFFANSDGWIQRYNEILLKL